MKKGQKPKAKLLTEAHAILRAMYCASDELTEWLCALSTKEYTALEDDELSYVFMGAAIGAALGELNIADLSNWMRCTADEIDAELKVDGWLAADQSAGVQLH